MKKYVDYKGFNILGYHVDSMNEQVLDVICDIMKYDEFDNIDYVLTFENLVKYYIDNLKSDTLWRDKYILKLIAGTRKCNELEAIIIEYLPQDIYIKYIIKKEK